MNPHAGRATQATGVLEAAEVPLTNTPRVADLDARPPRRSGPR